MSAGPRHVVVDQDQLDALKPACARILSVGGELRGTGYLVAPDVVMTCDHVVWNPKPPQRLAEVLCQFGDVGGPRLEATLERHDEEHDVALLRLGRPLEKVAPLRFADPDFRPLTWYAFGFPGFVDGLGVTLTGDVLDARATDREGKPAISVFTPMFGGGTPNLGGFSGSPVLSGGKLVGHLYRLLAAPGHPQEAQLGIAYVVPVRHLATLLGGQTAPAPIVAPSPGDADRAEAAAEAAKRVVRGIRAAGTPSDVRAALERGALQASAAEAPALLAAETLLGMGAAAEARAILCDVPASERRTQLEALALSLQGQHAEAHAMLLALPASDETAGLTGGVLKRRWVQSGARAWLQASHEAYRAEYDRKKTPYVGINVAATTLYLGDPVQSRAIAAEVRAALRAASPAPGDHWYFAMVGEAELLLGNVDAAREAYRRAVAERPGNARDVAVMRRQARLNLKYIGMRGDELDSVLPVGGVAAVIAAPATDKPPPDAGRIAALLAEHEVRFGFGSALRGGDIVFAERVLARDGTMQVILPSVPDEFVQTWVGPAWRARYEAIARSPVVVPAATGEAPFASCNRAVMREALELGRRLDERPFLIAICPPPGAPDLREVRAAVDEWNVAGTLDRVEAVVLEG